MNNLSIILYLIDLEDKRRLAKRIEKLKQERIKKKYNKSKRFNSENKLGQSINGDRGEEGRLLVSLISNKDNDASLLFSLFPPLGFINLIHAYKKIFRLYKFCEVEVDPEVCIHDKPLGECDICEEEKITGEEPEIEED